MKQKLLVLLLVIFSLSVIGAAGKTPTKDIPNQHIIFYARTSFGVLPVIIPKGALNTNKEGVYWDTPENYMEREKAKEKFRKEEEKFYRKYKKEHPEIYSKKQPI